MASGHAVVLFLLVSLLASLSLTWIRGPAWRAVEEGLGSIRNPMRAWLPGAVEKSGHCSR